MIGEYFISAISGIILGSIIAVIYLKIKNKKVKKNIPKKFVNEDLKIEQKYNEDVDESFSLEKHEKIKEKIKLLKEKKLLKETKIRKKKKVKKKKVKKKSKKKE